MAYLSTYIREMLTRRESVIFPGFGSLVVAEGKRGTGAEGRIEPPGYRIYFDATHPKGDGKLAGEYARGENMDPEEARQQVLELVDAIRFRLDKGEKFKLEGVGEFSRDEDSRIIFKKSSDWEPDPDAFGLDTLDILELDGNDEAQADESGEKVPEEHIVLEGSVAKEGESAVETPEIFHRRPVNKWKIIWIVTGSLIAVLVLVLMIPAGNGVEFGKDGLIIRDRDQQEEQVPATSGRTGSGEKIREVPKKSSPAKDVRSAVPESTVAPVEENRYFIIAGSFQNLANATELADQLKVSGFPAEIILTENRMYRVSIKSYTTREEALAEVSSIRERSGISGAWILTR